MRFSVPPLLLFLFAIFSVKTTCGKIPNDDWQTIFSEASQWNQNWPQTRVVFDIRQDSFGFSHRASIYRRNPNSSQTKNRVLFVDFNGFMWIYSPKTASWTRLSTSDINTDLTASRKYFSQLTNCKLDHESMRYSRYFVCRGLRRLPWAGNVQRDVVV